MKNGHSIPLGTEVEVIATDHGNVVTPCTGWVDDWKLSACAESKNGQDQHVNGS